MLINGTYCEITVSRVIEIVKADAQIVRVEFSASVQDYFGSLLERSANESDHAALVRKSQYAILQVLEQLPFGAKLTAGDAWPQVLVGMAEPLSQITPFKHEHTLFVARIAFTEAWNNVAALVAKDSPAADPAH